LFSNIWSAFIEKILIWTPKVLEFFLILILFLFLAKILQKIINRISKRFNLADNIKSLMIKTTKIVIIVFGLITALGTMGVNVSALVAGLGLTGFALGFAFKDTIANLLSGVLILIYKPFNVGNRIVVSGYEGDVISIDLRYTCLMRNNEKILIPNSKIFTEAIKIAKSDSK